MKNTMSNISGGQLLALLLIPDVFALLCIQGAVSWETTAAFAVSSAIQLLLAIPVVNLCRKGIPLGECRSIYRLIYLAYIIFRGSILFTMLWSISDILSFPNDIAGFIPEKLLISGLTAIVCAYAASGGFRVLSRASLIAAGIGAVSLIVMLIGAIPRIEAKNLTVQTGGSFASEIVRGLALSGGMGVFVVLLSHSGEKPMRFTVRYLAVRTVVTSVLLLAAGACVGGIMRFTDFPTAAAAEVSQPFSTQRTDSLFLITMAIFAVFALSVQTAAAAELLQGLFPKLSRFQSLICLMLMILSAAVFRADTLISAAASVIVLGLIPLIINLTEGGGRKCA